MTCPDGRSRNESSPRHNRPPSSYCHLDVIESAAPLNMIGGLATESVHTDLSTRAQRWTQVADWLEWPIAFLALLIIPALVLEERATDPRLREAAYITNCVVWIGFCLEFAIRCAAIPHLRFLREAWF